MQKVGTVNVDFTGWNLGFGEKIESIVVETLNEVIGDAIDEETLEPYVQWSARDGFEAVAAFKLFGEVYHRVNLASSIEQSVNLYFTSHPRTPYQSEEYVEVRDALLKLAQDITHIASRIHVEVA